MAHEESQGRLVSTEEADVCLLFGRPVTLTLPAGPAEEEEDHHHGDDDGEEGVERVVRVPPSSSAPALEVAREQVLEGLDLLHATTDRDSAQHQVKRKQPALPRRCRLHRSLTCLPRVNAVAAGWWGSADAACAGGGRFEAHGGGARVGGGACGGYGLATRAGEMG